MTALYVILWALALICFFLATFGNFAKTNLVALGLVFVSAVFLIQTLDSAL